MTLERLRRRKRAISAKEGETAMDKDEITNEQEALEAVKEDGLALRFVPDELNTAELRLEALLEEVPR